VRIDEELMEIWLNEVCDINNVLVETETKEEHNEIVEEILRRLEENNLHIKLKKCMWKLGS